MLERAHTSADEGFIIKQAEREPALPKAPDKKPNQDDPYPSDVLEGSVQMAKQQAKRQRCQQMPQCERRLVAKREKASKNERQEDQPNDQMVSGVPL
ncbi:MAG: hypothetical protein GEU99_00885 [Luteitalea sp.]|nr:hypothetical protein [Luteitalea sp.]